ncbi:hypothetical protein J31TS4_10540 [Paenibacillus sp. J31TS4]|uniref:hypothetical protein n=1 Tax=Paenibacillus sp. J31TS4 TaxID=2807195 RepID=UPI001B27B827|nr:hypothetical protein [Paenibacillus sp. J31TS4]GIP37774.1 hypothetical protein J31TS4_10540 [Paenibacillus sp. J31TS4]
MKNAIFAAETPDYALLDGAEIYPLADLETAELDSFESVLVLGAGSVESDTELSKDVLAKLWRYAFGGGKLYAELIAAFDFPSSRLFGWKQDFPRSRRTLEKLRVSGLAAPLPEGALLEWEGPLTIGFPLETESLLTFGSFQETHTAPSADHSHPGLFYRQFGQGVVAYSTFALFACRSRAALRPYRLWRDVVSMLTERTGIPLRMWSPVMEASGGTSADEAVRRTASWFRASGMLPAPDGSAGVYENIHSVTAKLSKDRRPDCHAHTALFFHLLGRYTGEAEWTELSHNLLRYLLDNGYQDTDPASPTYGFFKWYEFPADGPNQMFTDDNAWVAFVLLYLYRKTGIEEYKTRGLLTAEAMLATQNDQGLRANVLMAAQLKETGRDGARELEASMNPHFESIAHSAFLQAYLVTGERAYLNTALKGSLTLLERFDELKFMYSRTSGLNRLILPLGFLAKHDESGRIEAGLERVVDYLLANRHESGGIEEADNPDPARFGTEDTGVFLYNGEGIGDQLYTNNFLLMNAWEAYKATGSAKHLDLYNGLRDYMCRIQIASRDPRFDGGWMRAFDMKRGEYFGNNGDTGWGPYCMESGWTNAIAPAGLLLGLLGESVFE